MYKSYKVIEPVIGTESHEKTAVLLFFSIFQNTPPHAIKNKKGSKEKQSSLAIRAKRYSATAKHLK